MNTVHILHKIGSCIITSESIHTNPQALVMVYLLEAVLYTKQSSFSVVFSTGRTCREL